MTRYQFAAIMMLLWGIAGKLNKPSVYSTGAYCISLLYCVDAVIALWKSRNEETR
jgi:hypothetical protein